MEKTWWLKMHSMSYCINIPDHIIVTTETKIYESYHYSPAHICVWCASVFFAYPSPNFSVFVQYYSSIQLIFHRTFTASKMISVWNVLWHHLHSCNTRLKQIHQQSTMLREVISFGAYCCVMRTGYKIFDMISMQKYITRFPFINTVASKIDFPFRYS